MECLRFYTRQMSSPQGKPRVFFCCHPDDFADCFKRIADRILKEQNCAIWYREPTCRDAVPFSDLEQMQLFVMPVTTKLLTTQNRAIDVEFPFAIRQHIPVLPLMQEPGLEQLFNRRCGELQYLDEQAQDPTMLRFDDKLRRYLNDILIGEELAGKIRAAFDGYIFLSYRKKDRQYVTELMRKIHQNDFAKDIAIWYDEYLVPGENFNVSIAEALRKSELFTMLVTPNLANEPNYVSMTEYPEAVKAGKPILPVEASSTDQKTLRTRFQQLPPCVSIADEKELSAALMRSLRRMGKAENDGDPMHQYLIGLAYLNGIDVEVDYTRARELLTASAEQGMVDAMERLVSMYEHGKGVDYNLNEAAKWQKKCVAYYRNIVTQEASTILVEKMVDALLYLAEITLNALELDESEKAFNEAENICKNDRTMLPDRNTKWSRCWCGLGYVWLRRWQLEQSEACTRKAVQICSMNCRINRSSKSLYQKAFYLYQCGMICSLQEKNLAARKDLSEAVKVLSELEEYKSDSLMAAAYMQLGQLCLDKKQNEAAKGYFEQALQIQLQRTQTSNELRDWAVVAELYNKLGTVCQEKAHIYLKKAVTLYEKIEQSWPTEAFRLLTGRAIMELGEYNAKKKQYEKAETYYQQAEDKISKLAQETNSREAKALLSILLREQAELSAERNEHTRAQEFFKSSCRMLESQIERVKNEPVKIRALRAFFCAEQANKSRERHELSSAKAQYLKALGYYTDEMIQNGDRECRMLYMLLWSELADCFQQTDELQEAVSAYTQSLHTGGLLIAEDADIDLAENVADDAYNLGKLHWKLKQKAAARDAFLLQRRYALKSIEMSGNDEALRGNRFRLQFALRWLMTLDDNTDSRQTLAVYQEAWDNAALLAKEKDTDGLCKDRINILKKLKTIYQENNNCSTLRTLYTDAYTLANVLIEQGETPKRKNERAYILKELSAIHQAEGNAPMAEACCCDAQRLYKASAQALRTFASYDEWMVSSIMLGNIYSRRGAYKEAKLYYEEAIRVGESMERATPKEKTKRQLAFAKKCLQGMN